MKNETAINPPSQTLKEPNPLGKEIGAIVDNYRIISPGFSILTNNLYCQTGKMFSPTVLAELSKMVKEHRDLPEVILSIEDEISVLSFEISGNPNWIFDTGVEIISRNRSYSYPALGNLHGNSQTLVISDEADSLVYDDQSNVINMLRNNRWLVVLFWCAVYYVPKADNGRAAKRDLL